MIKGLVICLALVAVINLIQGYDLLENPEKTVAEKRDKNVAENSEKHVGEMRLEKFVKRTGKPNKLDWVIIVMNFRLISHKLAKKKIFNFNI